VIGQTVSHYKILEKIGAGGMGEVYLAEDTKLERKVALKFLPLHLTADREAKERFEREAKAAAALNHPNIVTVYEIGEHEGQVFIAMEYVEGKTLKELLSEHPTPSNLYPIPIPLVIDIALQVASGLAAAHAKGIVHRDIKPQNILVDKNIHVKILDFGLAKLKGVSSLTKESSTLGTVHYISPEQTLGKEVDHRTDIWSLGVVLYEMLNGDLPFRGDYEQAVIYSILNEEPAFPGTSSAVIPAGLKRVIGHALAKDPSRRYMNAADMMRELRGMAAEMGATGMGEEEGLPSIAAALKLTLTHEESRKIAERPIADVAAYQFYLKANAEIWTFNEHSLERARADLQKGLDILGDNALLYSAMAFVYFQYANIGAGQEDCIAKAEHYARKALALDPDSPQAHFVIGMSIWVFHGEKQREGINELKTAVELNPNYIDAMKLLAGFYTMSAGKLESAVPFVQRIRSIDPLDPWNYWLDGRLAFFAGEYERAADQFCRQYQLDPENSIVRFFYALALTYTGALAMAFDVIDRGAQEAPNNVFTKCGLLLKYGLHHDRESASREMSAEFQKTCRRDHQWSYLVAIPLALLDERKESLDWLENAVNTGFFNYTELVRNRYLDNIRGEERFKKLMKRVQREWENFEP
jgi:tetratricopeptide (TPR) repeat protein/predicted Ser/Thr protein kinase